MKEVIWNLKAREFIRSLDFTVKHEIGALIMVLQKGQSLFAPQCRPMKSIHKNAYEIRVKDSSVNSRVIYVLALRDKIIIPHAFTKKTQKTPNHEIELSKKRLLEILNESK
jgi:phage-related protein